MKDMIQYLIDLSNDIQEKNTDIQTTKARWDNYMGSKLRSWDFNKYAIQSLIEWGESGHNWQLLHWDENRSSEDYLEDFAGEINYCCDRMSLDRLFRCHWLLNAAINKHQLR